MPKSISDDAKYFLGSMFGRGQMLKFDRRYVVEHRDIKPFIKELVDAGYLVCQGGLPFDDSELVAYYVPADMSIKDAMRYAMDRNQTATPPPPRFRIYNNVSGKKSNVGQGKYG